MSEKDISRDACIQDLDRFAAELPLEHRQKLYRVAETFFHVGGGFGASIGVTSIFGVADTTERDAYVAYLRKKTDESADELAAHR